MASVRLGAVLPTRHSVAALSLTALTALFFLLALQGTPASAAPVANWTVMVYVSGDNDLEDYITDDLITELGVGSSDQVQVVALADRGPDYDTRFGDWQTTKLFHVQPGMLPNAANAVADWGERDMGAPATLTEFVGWARTNYPADHFALFFWGHGWSWHPGSTMLDATDGDGLDYDELRQALPALGFIDVVGYDACSMAALEMSNLWHGHATAVTASQEVVGGEGIAYDILLRHLKANPAMSADDVAINVTRHATNDATWSAVAVDGRLTAVQSTMNSFARSLARYDEGHHARLRQIISGSRHFTDAAMDRDLYDVTARLVAGTRDARVRASGRALMRAIDSAVLMERHVPAMSGAHGITTYLPLTSPERSDWDFYFNTVAPNLDRDWLSFLQRVHR